MIYGCDKYSKGHIMGHITDNEKYKLFCGDSLEVMKQFSDNSVDSCITDPPYGMNIANVGWDRNVPPTEIWKEVYRVMKPGAFILSFSSPEFYHRMAINVEDAGFRPMDMIFWMVTTKMAKANRLKPAHEPIFVAQKPVTGTIVSNHEKYNCGKINIEEARVPWDTAPPKGWVANGLKRRSFGSEVNKTTGNEDKVDANPNGRYPSNIIGHFDVPEHQKYFYAPRVSKKERGEYNDHPTPKPISLMEYLIKIYSNPGNTILDPFMGSGSTGIATLLNNRKFVGIDQSQHYIDITEKRFADYDIF